MSVTPGTRIGPYEIQLPIGAGGMGEVYRARDTRLKRDVAVKILPDAFAADPDRLARFQREAEVLASLNHPHIATIHGLEQSGTRQALVLELVEGDTLAERLTRGALPVDVALRIGRQIADALEAAHQQGIVHRDLKPANIKVTSDGTVKVLDFGLATIIADPSSAAGDATYSPTLTLGATRAGVILGTAAYMSPEQASGKTADRRSDVWSFAVVLMEMLTGRRLFDGETISHTLAFVLTKDPDWSTLPPSTPPSIHRLLRRCLERDQRRRLSDIGSVRLEIEEALAAPASLAPTTLIQPASRLVRVAPWVVAALAAAIAVGSVAPRSTPNPVPLVKANMDIGADATLVLQGAPSAPLALSPAGDVLAFVAEDERGVSQLYVRRLDQLHAAALSGTGGARNPFFSPDGQWIAFWADGKMKKISVTGGAALPLADSPATRGGDWMADDTIIYTPESGPGGALMTIRGHAKPSALIRLADGEQSQRWPQTLPGGKAVLFTSSRSLGGSWDDGDIVVQRLPDGPRNVLLRGGYFGRYVSTGHLIYINGGTLFAAPFDIDMLELTGEGVPVVEGVAASTGTGAAQFAIARNGTLIYVPGEATGGFDDVMVWSDRKGKSSPLRATASGWSNPAFAPDGSKRIAFDVSSGGVLGSTDIFVYEWDRDTATRVTFYQGVDLKPVWSPGGRWIAYASGRDGTSLPDIYVMRADGTGSAQRIVDSEAVEAPGSWHPSGRFIAFERQNAATGWDIYILPIEGDENGGWKAGAPIAFLTDVQDQREPIFSPNGKWLAYTSNDNQGQTEVFVRPFPGDFKEKKQLPEGKWQVSSGGGAYPSWSLKRPELWFATSDGQIGTASYRVAGTALLFDKAAMLPIRFQTRPRLRPYALHPDGERLAIAPRSETPASKVNKVVLALNFAEQLKRVARGN